MNNHIPMTRQTLRVSRPALWVVLCLWAGGSSLCGQQASDPSQIQHSADEQTLLETADALSATTLREGAGWDAYAGFLHEDFTRWSAGRDVLDRTQTVEMIRGWWEGGNRTATSETQLISLRVSQTTGVIRRKFHERFCDQQGNETGSFDGYVTQVWIRMGQEWKLLAATIQPAT